MQIPGLGSAIRAARALSRYAQVSYSEEGEDLIVGDLFLGRKPGFYVDIGAYHPWQYSNTFLLYKSGWHGINIDAMPGAMRPFRLARRRDINLELGVTDAPSELTFNIFEERALNTFDPVRARRLIAEGSKFARTTQVRCLPLRDILAEHAPDRNVDFMSIDVEGHELEVLRSNDWNRWRPEVLLAEITATVDEISKTAVGKMLADLGYRPVAKTVRTAVFRR